MSRRTIALTGAAGLLGQRVLPLLDASDDVARIVGFDVRDPARRARKLEFHRCDIGGGTDLARMLEGVDVVVHLAAIVGPIPDDRLFERVNVGGTRRVLEGASAAGVRAVVRPSSAAVYGAWPNNPVPLSEDAPLRPNPGFTPAAVDAECERLLDAWRSEGEGRRVAVLRIAPVVGGGARTLFAQIATGHPPVGVRGATPPVQVTHVDDAASALAFAALEPLDGVYNVASDGWLSHEDAVALLPRRPLPGLPPEAAERTLAALWATGLGDAPPSVLPYLVQPWVIANDRLKAAGWSPRHGNDEAILLATPTTASNALPWAAAVGAVVAGAAVSTWWLTRRHRRHRRR
jgi:nucleoside-diphosphate-sugar epimerase